MDRDMQEILAAVSAGKLTPDEAEAAIAALEAAQGEPAPAEDPMPQDQPDPTPDKQSASSQEADPDGANASAGGAAWTQGPSAQGRPLEERLQDSADRLNQWAEDFSRGAASFAEDMGRGAAPSSTSSSSTVKTTRLSPAVARLRDSGESISGVPRL